MGSLGYLLGGSIRSLLTGGVRVDPILQLFTKCVVRPLTVEQRGVALVVTTWGGGDEGGC